MNEDLIEDRLESCEGRLAALEAGSQSQRRTTECMSLAHGKHRERIHKLERDVQMLVEEAGELRRRLVKAEDVANQVDALADRLATIEKRAETGDVKRCTYDNGGGGVFAYDSLPSVTVSCDPLNPPSPKSICQSIQYAKAFCQDRVILSGDAADCVVHLLQTQHPTIETKNDSTVSWTVDVPASVTSLHEQIDRLTAERDAAIEQREDFARRTRMAESATLRLSNLILSRDKVLDELRRERDAIAAAARGATRIIAEGLEKAGGAA